MSPRLAMTGGAAATPAPIVQVVADLHDGTRPAGVGSERCGAVVVSGVILAERQPPLRAEWAPMTWLRYGSPRLGARWDVADAPQRSAAAQSQCASRVRRGRVGVGGRSEISTALPPTGR